MKPIFAVYKPAFMGLVEEVNLPEGTLDSFKGESSVVGDKPIHLYLHGDLETQAKFDIPQLLQGDVTTQPEQECTVVMPNGEIFPAILCLRDEKWRYYGLITTHKEKDAIKS